jgi:hypothetical protein
MHRGLRCVYASASRCYLQLILNFRFAVTREERVLRTFHDKRTPTTKRRREVKEMSELRYRDRKA